MKLQASLLLLALAPGSCSVVPARDKLFKRTLSDAKSEAAFVGATPGHRYTERRLATNTPGLDLGALAASASPAQLKLLTRATDDYWGSLFPSMFNMLSVEDAGVAFEQFPFLKTMPAYKDFAASGSTDPVKKGAAQLGALQDMLVSLSDFKGKMGGKGGSAGIVEAMISEGSPELKADVEAVTKGDAKAMHRVQQAFSDKFFGGADVSAMYDNTWIDKSRADLESDDMLKRLIGEDSGILDILLNKEVRLLDPTQDAANFDHSVRRLHAAMTPEGSV